MKVFKRQLDQLSAEKEKCSGEFVKQSFLKDFTNQMMKMANMLFDNVNVKNKKK